MAADFHVWDRVPDGATLWLHLEPGPFRGRARVVRSYRGTPLEDIEIRQMDLTGQPFAIQISAGVSYSVRVKLEFPAPRGSTLLRAWITRPDGAPYRSAFEYAVTGQLGDVFRATLLATTDAIDLDG